MFIAHRGNGKHRYLENTKEAILNVLKEEVDGVEFDIRMTKDEKFVIFHDPIINRQIIRLSELKDLKKINLKGGFEIPELTEVLDKINTDKKIIIEIKSEFDDNNLIAKRLCDIIKKYKLNIYLCSFNKKLIDLVSNFVDKTGLIIGYYINNQYLINNYDYNIIHYYYKDKIDKKKETFIWTINDKKKLKDIDKNSYIITDKYYLIK